MTNREKINAMTDEEIANKLCRLVEDIAIKAGEDYACKLCPVEKICKKGTNGFFAHLSADAETEGN